MQTSTSLCSHQFLCTHCHRTSFVFGIVNMKKNDHCDWIACMHCNKLNRMALVEMMSISPPINVSRTYVFDKDGQIIFRIMEPKQQISRKRWCCFLK